MSALGETRPLQSKDLTPYLDHPVEIEHLADARGTKARAADSVPLCLPIGYTGRIRALVKVRFMSPQGHFHCIRNGRICRSLFVE